MNIISKKFIALAFASALVLSFNAQAREHQDVVKDVRGNVVHATNGTCVLTQWMSESGSECSGGRFRSVYFDFNKATLTREARATLNEVVAYINSSENGVKSINIVGYADSIGGDSYNQRLSDKRAGNVKRYLASKGSTREANVEVRGMGESNVSEEKCEGLTGRKKIDCLWEERRVDIELNM